jgi:hypothetical protein
MDWELCLRKHRLFEVERYQLAAGLWREWKLMYPEMNFLVEVRTFFAENPSE